MYSILAADSVKFKDSSFKMVEDMTFMEDFSMLYQMIAKH